MHIIFRRYSLYFLALLLLLSSSIGVLIPANASAAVGAVDNPQDQLIRYLFYRGMRACLNDADFDGTPGDDNQDISVDDINEGHLNLQEKRGFGFIAPSLEDGVSTGEAAKGIDTDGTLGCNDGSIWVRGATLFGFADVVDLVCTMNTALSTDGALSKTDNDRIQPDKDGGPGREICRDSNKIYFDGGDSIFQEALTWALENGGDKNRPYADIDDNDGATYDSDALRYLVGWRSLVNFCGSLGANVDDMLYESDDFDGNKVVSVRYVKPDGTTDPRHAFSIGGKDENNKWWDDVRTEGTSIDDVWYDGKTEENASGMKCSTMAEWTRLYEKAYADWARTHSTDAEENESTLGSDKEDSSGSGDSTTSCGVDGVGWIICPVMEFMGKLNDAAFGFIDDFLYVEPRLLADSDTRAAWSNFRDLANVAFIIAFLVIVYSQITSAGVSNYGIKRMLPRIFVAALLVNMSYFICQIAVDLSNIAGSSLYSFFKDIPTTDAITSTAESMPSWKKVIAFILIGTGVLAIGLLAMTAIGTAALLAFVLVMLILIARKALLIILVVVAPLAFVAYLLPNTEKWFKSWWKMFSTLLMVFPIVAVIFGASTLAARIINNAGANPNENNYMLQITALGVMALPLFAVPAVLKGAMSAAGTLGARLQSMADKAQGRAGDKSKDRVGKEFKDLGNRFTNRALNSTSRRGAAARLVSGVGRRAKREDRYKQNQTLRESSQESFLNQGIDVTDPNNITATDKTAQRRVDAAAAKKTADTTNQIVGNLGAQSSMSNNAAIYKAAATSGEATHHQEDTLKNKGKSDYYNDRRNDGHLAENLSALENSQAAETGAMNRVKTGITPGSVEARQAIAANKAAKGEEKMVDQGLELSYQSSDIGRSQVQGLKAIEGELEIEHSDQKNTFEGSAVGTAQAQQKKVIQGTAKIIEGDAQLAYEESGIGKTIEEANLGIQSQVSTAQTATKAAFTASKPGQDLNLKGAVVQATLGAAEAANKAQVDELKAGAEAAGVVGTSLEQVAIDLSEADIQTRAQGQRSASAQNVANTEYAGKVKASQGVTGGLADISGGIDEYGASRAVAVASQIWDKQLVEAIGAQKTLFESTPGDKLEAEYKTGFVDGDPSKGRSSPERMAAVAGTIAGRGYMGGKLELLKETGSALKKAKADARARGLTTDEEINNDPAVSAVIFSQKQISADMREWPFGASDTMRDMLGLGQWEGDFDAGFQTRIGTKLTGAKLGTLKAEELADLEAVFPSLTPEQHASLDAAVEEAKTNEAVRKDIKPEIWSSLERMGYSRP